MSDITGRFIEDGTITNADINASAGIGRSKLASGTASRVLVNDGSGVLSDSSVTSTELGYLSGVTSAIQTQINGKQSLSTLTAKGDLFAATASATTTRLPVGIDGTFLKADSSQSTGLAWTSTISTSAFRSVTTTDTATTADDILVLSGASFTETLFTAVGNTGKQITLIHNGTSLTQVYTLNTTSGQTIGGIASGSYVLRTNGEVLKLVSDGSNWLILEHRTETAWVDAGAITITATTTNPTKGTIVVDKIYWMRRGDTVHVRGEYRQSGGSPAAGSGDYKFATPASISLNTSLITVYTTVEGNGGFYLNNSIGGYTASTTDAAVTGQSTGAVVVFDATNVRLAGIETGNTGYIGSGFEGLGNSNCCYSFYYSAPVTGWQP